MLKSILGNPYKRVLLRAALGLGLNLFYALYHGVLGMMSQSLWLLLLCVYYVILSIMRFAVMLYGGRKKSGEDSSSEGFLSCFLGGMLVVLAAVLACSVYLSFCYDVAIVHHEIMMITIAAYTFYKLTMVIVNAVKARKKKSMWLIALRNIDCVDAAASILTLQRSMLVSFEGMSGQEIGIMNALTGAGVCFMVAALGIYMIFKKRKAWLLK